MQDRIEKTIELDAPLASVWRALTDHVEFGAWFRVALDEPFSVGKVTRGQITYEGHEHLAWSATVRAMEPRTYFAFNWCPLAEDDPEAPKTLVEFKLESIAGGTRLTVAESGFSAIEDPGDREEALLRNSSGWDIQVQNIAAHVESQPGRTP